MIESVNTAVPQQLPLSARQTAPAAAVSAAPAGPPANAPVYVSPNIRIDIQTQQAVVEYRNSSTGEVENQYPSESQLRAYARTPAENPQSHAVETKT